MVRMLVMKINCLWISVSLYFVRVTTLPRCVLDGSLETFDSPNGKKQPAAKPCDMSVVYVCEQSEIKGKFDPEKAKALGLKPGPKYRELQLENSVKSDRQNIVVLPTDVLGPSLPGPIVLHLDCPT